MDKAHDMAVAALAAPGYVPDIPVLVVVSIIMFAVTFTVWWYVR